MCLDFDSGNVSGFVYFGIKLNLEILKNNFGLDLEFGDIHESGIFWIWAHREGSNLNF